MLNSISTLENQAGFLAAREFWLKSVLANRIIEERAKLVAIGMYFHFNRERWERDRKLYAFPRKSVLREIIGESTSTVKRGLADLETFGYLKVKRRYDHERHRQTSSIYLAQVPPPGGLGFSTDPGVGSLLNPCNRLYDSTL
jgi:hypothetical protein